MLWLSGLFRRFCDGLALCNFGFPAGGGNLGFGFALGGLGGLVGVKLRGDAGFFWRAWEVVEHVVKIGRSLYLEKHLLTSKRGQ